MLAKFFKKQSLGFYILCGAFLIGFIGMIIYFVSCSSVGYFQEAYVDNTTLFIFLGLASLLIALVGSQFHLNGILETVLSVLRGIFTIGGGIFYMAGMMYYINDRSEGFGYIFGSNEEILATIQTPENMLSANLAIATIVFLGITIVVCWVAAFFPLSTKQEEAVPAEANN